LGRTLSSLAGMKNTNNYNIKLFEIMHTVCLQVDRDICKETAEFKNKVCYNVELIVLQIRYDETLVSTAFGDACVVFGCRNGLNNKYY
jgi:hypothetical protein